MTAFDWAVFAAAWLLGMWMLRPVKLAKRQPGRPVQAVRVDRAGKLRAGERQWRSK